MKSTRICRIKRDPALAPRLAALRLAHAPFIPPPFVDPIPHASSSKTPYSPRKFSTRSCVLSEAVDQGQSAQHLEGTDIQRSAPHQTAERKGKGPAVRPRSSPAAHKAWSFKRALYEEPAAEKEDEEFLLARLVAAIRVDPASSSTVAQTPPDPSQVLNAALSFLKNGRRQKGLGPFAAHIAQSIAGHFSSKGQPLSLQQAAGDVLMACFVEAARIRSDRSDLENAMDTARAADQVFNHYATYIINRTLQAADHKDEKTLASLWGLMETTFQKYQALGTAYPMPVPLVAASVVLRQHVEVAREAQYRFIWPNAQLVETYLFEVMNQRNRSPTQYVSAIKKTNQEVPTPDLPATPQQLFEHLGRLISRGLEREIIDTWGSFRDHVKKNPISKPVPPRSLFDPKVKMEVLSIFLYAIRAPRFGDNPPRMLEALDICSDEILSMSTRPLPRDMLHTLMANRARVVGGSTPDVEKGTEVYSLDPRAEALVSSPKPPVAYAEANTVLATKKEVALKNLHDIWELAHQPGAERDPKLYMLYMEGLGRLGDTDTLQTVWNEMVTDEACEAIYRKDEGKDGGSYPPTKALNQLLSALLLVPGGQPMAIYLFRQASEPTSAVPCNIITINTVLRHHARNGNLYAMQDLFTLADKLGLRPDIVTFTTLIQGLLRVERLDLAKESLAAMGAAQLKPNERMCTVLIADLAKDGRRVGLTTAEELMLEMKKRGFQVGVVAWTALISGYFRGGWIDDGWEAVQRMETQGLKFNRVSYNVILKQAGERIMAASRNEKEPMTIRILNKMLREGVSPNSDTFTIVLIPLIKARLWHHADEVIRLMGVLNHRPEKNQLKELIRKTKLRRAMDFDPTSGKEKRLTTKPVVY